jgi:hypothetical protein
MCPEQWICTSAPPIRLHGALLLGQETETKENFWRLIFDLLMIHISPGAIKNAPLFCFVMPHKFVNYGCFGEDVYHLLQDKLRKTAFVSIR